MSKEQTKDLLKFLSTLPEEIKEIAMWLREFVWDVYPNTTELIYYNYNAVAFWCSLTEKVGHTFCSIAVGQSSHNVHFGFYWGTEISDPEKNSFRKRKSISKHTCKEQRRISKNVYKKLVKEAYANSITKVKDTKQIIHGMTITKSVSDKKRKPSEKKK